MSFKKNPGINRLARVLTDRMQKEAANKIEVPFDFGVIMSDYSLQTDTYPEPIPNGEYLLCRQLTLGKKDEVLTRTQKIGMKNDGRHPNVESAHIHDVLIPEKMASLLPGDRVLVAWVADDAVIIDVVEES